MNKTVSIIIPVYDVENYISKCIESVISQSYKDLEIILVDDGSTDDSNNICQRYAKEDDRIKVIQQDNSGVSSARNKGLACAKGDYVMFVDGDDAIDAKMIELMMEEMPSDDKTATLVACESTKCQDNLGQKYGNGKSIYFNREEAIKDCLYMKNTSNAPWAKLIPSKIAKSIKFNPKITIAEDLDYIYRVMQKIDNEIFINRNLYYYRITPGSAMTKPFTKRRMDGFLSTRGIVSHALQTKNDRIIKAAKFRHFAEAFFILLSIGENRLKYRKQYKEACGELNKYKFNVAINKEAPKKFRLLAVLSIINVNLAMFLSKLKMGKKA